MSMRNWPWEYVQEVLRNYGREIGLLARRGDRLARNVMQRYQYAHDHPNDLDANLSLRDALDDYLQRDLRIAERAELGSRFGHLIDESERGPTIIVPASLSRQ